MKTLAASGEGTAATVRRGVGNSPDIRDLCALLVRPYEGCLGCAFICSPLPFRNTNFMLESDFKNLKEMKEINYRTQNPLCCLEIEISSQGKTDVDK